MKKLNLINLTLKANLNAAQSNIDLAKKDLERYRNLYEQGAVSKQTYDAAVVKYDTAQADLTQANQALFSDKNGKTVADANLRSAKAAKDKAALDLSYTKSMLRKPEQYHPAELKKVCMLQQEHRYLL